MLAADGVDVSKNGDHYRAKLRPDERTASCHVWPPGAGRFGERGWTYHDYGPGKGGDALGYLLDVNGLEFADAVAFLAEKTGFWPAGWDRMGKSASESTRTRRKAPARHPDTPTRAKPVAAPLLTQNAQARAVQTFLEELSELFPETADKGAEYLKGRGCLPQGGPPVAYLLPRSIGPALLDALKNHPERAALERAGLLKPAGDGKPDRLPWWGDVVLLVCHAADVPAGYLKPVYLVGRRLDWKPGDQAGKYINQPTRAGAVRYPFGPPAMHLPRRWFPLDSAKAGAVLLVEGILDALGANVLGWPAVALLTRPQAHNPTDRHGAAATMLADHLPALRDAQQLLVIPDADAGEKGATGEALAAKLVGWLRAGGCRAAVATLAELCPDAPAHCKDLADVAKAQS